MNVLVYSGPGSSKRGVELLRDALRNLLNDSHDVMLATAKTFKDEPWEESTALVAFPGGRDLPYVSELKGEPNARIKRWVEGGGRYLGICAGAYYAASEIAFDKGNAYEVLGARELSFFPGLCEGPTYPGFVYDSEKGARNVEIDLSTDLKAKSDVATVYWNGGGVFVPPTELAESPDYQIIARHRDVEHKNVAVVLCRQGTGLALLSAVHPEYPLVPDQIINSSSVKPSELMHSFLHLLGMATSASERSPTITPILLLSRDFDCVSSLVDKLRTTFTINFEEKFEDANDQFVLLDSTSVLSTSEGCKSLVYAKEALQSYPQIPFSISLFWNHLRSVKIAATMMYGEVVTSTQTMLDKNPRFLSSLPDGFLALASYQIAGRGRGNNAWLSPAGCLPFSLVLRVPLSMASKIVFVQYLFALAVVEALDTLGGANKGLGMCIKWPNDIYADLGTSAEDGQRYKKLGGILVNSSYSKSQFTLVVGCGINVANARPTLSLRDLTDNYNTRHSTQIAFPSLEEALAAVLSAFEPMWQTFVAAASFEPFLKRYLARWIHSDQFIHIEDNGRRAQIDSITLDHGLLRAHYVDHAGRHEDEIVDLQPDGNSFDMLRGLIRRKA